EQLRHEEEGAVMMFFPAGNFGSWRRNRMAPSPRWTKQRTHGPRGMIETVRFGAPRYRSRSRMDDARTAASQSVALHWTLVRQSFSEAKPMEPMRLLEECEDTFTRLILGAHRDDRP